MKGVMRVIRILFEWLGARGQYTCTCTSGNYMYTYLMRDEKE